MLEPPRRVAGRALVELASTRKRVYTPIMKLTSDDGRPARAREYTDQCVCFNVRMASRKITSFYNKHLEASGVLITQFSILVALHFAGPTPQTQLARLLDMDRTTLARNWLPLVRDGLASEQPGQDRRTRVLHLTKKGERAFQIAVPLWQEAQAKVAARMGADGMRLLLDQLRMIPTPQ